MRERRAARDAALIIILLEFLEQKQASPINMHDDDDHRRMKDSTLKTDHSPMLIDRPVRKIESL